MSIRSREALIEFVNQGNQVDYLFFWGHRKPKQGVAKTCFSQWYESPFEVDGVNYPTAEHFMMSGKARLFRDEETLA
ncbi:MAG: NADAR family protein [Pseudomonadota bacterium]